MGLLGQDHFLTKRYPSSVICHTLRLAIGYWLLAIGYWLLAIGAAPARGYDSHRRPNWN
jgi:hypothetical protein